jgi:hypothetical protein
MVVLGGGAVSHERGTPLDICLNATSPVRHGELIRSLSRVYLVQNGNLEYGERRWGLNSRHQITGVSCLGYDLLERITSLLLAGVDWKVSRRPDTEVPRS